MIHVHAEADLLEARVVDLHGVDHGRGAVFKLAKDKHLKVGHEFDHVANGNIGHIPEPEQLEDPQVDH